MERRFDLASVRRTILPRRNRDAMVQGYGSHATGGYAASGYDQGAPQGYAPAAPQASLTRRRIQHSASAVATPSRWCVEIGSRPRRSARPWQSPRRLHGEDPQPCCQERKGWLPCAPTNIRCRLFAAALRCVCACACFGRLTLCLRVRGAGARARARVFVWAAGTLAPFGLAGCPGRQLQHTRNQRQPTLRSTTKVS